MKHKLLLDLHLPEIEGRSVWVGSNGYPSITIKKVHTSIHRLVATKMFGEIPKGMEVNHKNGNKWDARTTNLELMTGRENLHHAMRNGLHAKPEKAVIAYNDKGEGGWFISLRRAEEVLGVDRSSISKAVRGLLRTAGGYYWTLAEETL